MTPQATKVLLVATLFTTIAAVVVFATSGRPHEPRFVGWFLLLFSLLFLLRVVGQVVVARAAPSWLPPMQRWNLMPYPLLLPIQIVFLGVMAWIVVSFLREAPPGAPEWSGKLVVGFAAVYAASMVVRYVVRMSRRPAERWFGGTIPIVFHVVLASFVYVFGAFHATS